VLELEAIDDFLGREALGPLAVCRKASSKSGGNI
jgi:hypothetical protein